jgi:hypothetical protein
MSRALLVLSASLIWLAAGIASADVYRYEYVDQSGKKQVIYTDKPELLPAEIMARIKSQRTDNSAVAERNAAQQQQYDSISSSQAAADDKSKSQKNTAADKADRCAKARERYDQVMSAQRLYTQNDKGEKTFMDEKEVDKARASAKQLMDTWCN